MRHNSVLISLIIQAVQTFPHMRLGQIIWNAVNFDLSEPRELFYISDEELAKAIAIYLNRYGKQSGEKS